MFCKIASLPALWQSVELIKKDFSIFHPLQLFILILKVTVGFSTYIIVFLTLEQVKSSFLSLATFPAFIIF